MGTLLFCSSCDKNQLYEKNLEIAKDTWFTTDVKTFAVMIDDTLVPYRFYINVRHANWYPFNNLWVRFSATCPDGTTSEEKLQLKLSNDDQTGWLGDGLGDIYDLRCPVTPKIRREKGKYVFQIQQVMRQDPLPGLMAVGLRVEKVR